MTDPLRMIARSQADAAMVKHTVDQRAVMLNASRLRQGLLPDNRMCTIENYKLYRKYVRREFLNPLFKERDRLGLTTKQYAEILRNKQ